MNGPPPAITIGTAAPIIDYGQSTHISGVVSNKKAGETVTVFAQPYGQASPVLLATLLTTTNGVWDVLVKPTLLTTYSGALEDHRQPADRRPASAGRHVLGGEALGLGEDQG